LLDALIGTRPTVATQFTVGGDDHIALATAIDT
jgi:hypothetical protein